MTHEQAIQLLIEGDHTAEVRSLVASGHDPGGAGTAYLAQKRLSGTQTDSAGSAGEGNGKMDKAFRKLMIDAGPIGTIRKSIYNDALKSLGEELRQDGDSDAKAYVRAMETAEGRELHALYKVAAADPPQDEVEQPKPPKGPANLEMDTLAALHRKKNPKLSSAQAYTAVLLAEENRELAARVKREDIEAAQGRRTPAGRRLPFENPNRAEGAHRDALRTRGP